MLLPSESHLIDDCCIMLEYKVPFIIFALIFGWIYNIFWIGIGICGVFLLWASTLVHWSADRPPDSHM